jgi:hypothetical protein
MTTYFVKATHVTYLPERYREHSDLDNIASRVEADVISQYTKFQHPLGYTARTYNPTATEINSDTGLSVFLSEYEVDADDADTNFADAMARTIADVIAWRIRWEAANPLLSAESSDLGKSRTYRTTAISMFPPNWDSRLRPYDTREAGWGL